MDHKTFGRWIAAPFKALIAPVLLLVVALAFVLWLSLFAVEKMTGHQTLPEFLAPARTTPVQQIADDEVDCGVKNVLVDMKAAENKSKVVEDDILKTLLNQKCFYKKSLCNILYDMDTLRPLGKAREGVPRRQDWYMSFEFALEGKRMRALAQRTRELEKLGYGHEVKSEFLGSHYLRPDRKRTKGNQTPAEKKELTETLVEVRKADGFTFLQPRVPPMKCLE